MTPFYEQDGIQIFHGDCRDVLPSLDGKFDLVLTDPPYGISMRGVKHDKGRGKGVRNFDFLPNDTHEQSTEIAKEAIRASEHLLKPNGSGYAWMGHTQFAELVLDLRSRGWKTRFLVWERTCPPPTPPGSGWKSTADLCLYWFRPGRKWTHTGLNPPPGNVIHADSYRYGKPGKNGHPTQKPFECVNPLIVASTNEGDAVLDPFAGSGTTLVAAKKLGRRAVGIELEERYCEIAANRLRQRVLAVKE